MGKWRCNVGAKKWDEHEHTWVWSVTIVYWDVLCWPRAWELSDIILGKNHRDRSGKLGLGSTVNRVLIRSRNLYSLCGIIFQNCPSVKLDIRKSWANRETDTAYDFGVCHRELFFTRGRNDENIFHLSLSARFESLSLFPRAKSRSEKSHVDQKIIKVWKSW